jgi:CHAT domain-containing protein
MAESFLYAGAASVIAPLWSIDDGIAREIATEFYRAAFDGASPATILRRLRGEFRPDAPTALSATYLAYRYFGHPSLSIRREGR